MRTKLSIFVGVLLLLFVAVFLYGGELKRDLLKEVKTFSERLSSEHFTEAKPSMIATAERLKELGFSRVSFVRDIDTYKEKREYVSEAIKNIKYYSEKYPWNPFLTKNEIVRIAEKYGLLIGRPHDFTGDIPEQNMHDITNFSLNVENDSPAGKMSFVIMAPPDLLDLDGRIIRDGVFVEPDPDPIVFAEVKGGYLFITAWGPDAVAPMNEIRELLEQFESYTNKSGVFLDYENGIVVGTGLSISGTTIIWDTEMDNTSGLLWAHTTADTLWTTVTQ